MNIDFTGKNVVTTGAGSGLGKAVALEYVKSGATVWFGEISEDNAKTTLEELRAINPKCGYTKTDVSQKGDIEKLFADAVGNLGEIHAAANCAGVFSARDVLEVTPDEIKSHLGINLYGTIFFDQVAMAQFIKQGKGGFIVNISSVGGRRGEPNAPIYVLGKAGVINFTQSAALFGAKHNIKVNCVCPGIIRTKIWDVILDDYSQATGENDHEKLYMDAVKARVPLGRDQPAEDIAYGVLYLSSPYAENITGQSWNICGGDAMN